MLNRRNFLKNSGALALGGMALSNAAWSHVLPANYPIGIQLFTFFGQLDNDLTGILKQIADLGYKDLESAFSMKGGYYGLKPKEFAQVAKDLGLGWRSHHVMGTPFVPPPDVKLPDGFQKMRSLRDNYQELIDEAAEGGVKYLVCASIDIKSGDAVKSSIEILSKTGEACKKAGLTLAYHNHDGEFKNVDGIVPYDLFLSQLNKDIKMELDLAWVSKAGLDPVELFKKHPGRFPLWHVKDFDKEFKTLMPVGSGVIDFKRIFDNAKLAGLVHPFVEHDMPPNAMESITSSIKYLNGILK
ncbi:MAG TPA: sugar phosphate isomerase/epimerase [Chryseolinea sp.]|nr:sugar phosphate isomerase/epimerase [Chryseolinea sp.]HPH46482.1 sugar phosphate isomerase/epimerase [Chryseolinea sp.]HPM31084.1 sugar phosphate isomerase/epimerase [Chryseolinea sp.]